MFTCVDYLMVIILFVPNWPKSLYSTFIQIIVRCNATAIFYHNSVRMLVLDGKTI